jgi:hypothetical protein
MTLPPRAIQALVDIKKGLLSCVNSTQSQLSPLDEGKSVMITLSDPPISRKAPISKVSMRHAKAPNAYQRWKQRHDVW